MRPTLGLGPPHLGAPTIEIARSELYPILAAMLDARRSLSDECRDDLLMLVSLDTSFLSKKKASFFFALEDTCKRIVAGEITTYDRSVAKTPEFEGMLLLPDDGDTLDASALAAARRFIDFLEAHPEYWPPKAE